jgi:uncharacterized membrane protein
MFLETLTTAIVMLIIDMIWLTSRYKYHNDLFRSIQGSDPKIRIIPAILIYVLIPIAVMVFAVLPSTEIETAALRGAFLGFCMYGVYDLTNYATLTNYTLEMTIIDMLWGTFICAVGASTAYVLRRHVFRRQYSMFNLSWLSHFKYQYPQKRIEI